MKEMSGLDFACIDRFTEAMTHPSYGAEKDNTQLALLGDAVINLAVCDHMLTAYPELAVGAMTERRAAIVNRAFLAQRAKTLQLDKHLLLGQGEQLLGEEDKERILAEALEALVGAAFSARGYAAAKRFIARHIIPHTIVTKSWNPKGKLQEITQAQGQGTPRYETTEIAQGERKGFRTIVRINDAPLGAGEGKSKRESEENAAQIALAIFKQRT